MKLDIVHCLKYIFYVWRFESYLYSRVQMIGCHDTDIVDTIVIIIDNCQNAGI
jgi:hypothetical protein